MKIKLVMVKKLSYYFCGSVALSILNDVDNPLEVELDSLTRQELVGLDRAISTDIIRVTVGLSEFKAKVEAIVKPKKRTEPVKEEVIEVKTEVKIEEVKEEIEVTPVEEITPVVEVEEEPTEVVEKVEEVKKETPVKPTSVARKQPRNTTKK